MARKPADGHGARRDPPPPPRPAGPHEARTPHWPACWHDALQVVQDGIAQGCPVLLLLAPEGFGKSTFLAALAGGSTGVRGAAAVAPPPRFRLAAADAAGDWLAPVMTALALADDPAALAEGRPQARQRLGRWLAAGGIEAGGTEAGGTGAGAPVAGAPGAGADGRLVLAVDDADRLGDAALRELLMTIAEAAMRNGRPDDADHPGERRPDRRAAPPAGGTLPGGGALATLLLAGEPGLAGRVGRLLPTRFARSIPRASLPRWPVADIADFLAAERAAGGGRTVPAPKMAERVAQMTGGRPAALVAIRDGTATAPAAAAMAPPTADPAAGMPAAGTPPGLAECAPAAWPLAAAADTAAIAAADSWSARAGPLIGRPLDPAAVPGRGIGVVGLRLGGRPAKKRSPRLWPLAAVTVAVVVAGWALWNERRAALPPPLPAGEAATAGDRDPRLPTSGPLAAPPSSAPPIAAGVATAAAPSAAAAQPAPTAPPVPPPEPPPVPGSPTSATAPPPLPADAGAPAADWMARGDALLKLADVSAARQFYLLAARQGAAAGLTAAAATYDPLRLRELGVAGARGDAGQAIALYRQAIRQGDVVAHDRLWALIQKLRQEGRIDDAEARRLLQR